MVDQTLSQSQEAADLARAPASGPATATIVPDAPRLSGEDDEPDLPPPPNGPEIEPGGAPETDPDLQPTIPPVDNPTF